MDNKFLDKKLSIVCGLGLAAAFVACGSYGLPQTPSVPRALPAQRISGRRLPAHQLGRYLSPDKRFLAQVIVGEAEVKQLTIYTVHSRKRSSKASSASRASIIPIVSEVQGFAWVPGRPHTLIISADGSEYGLAMLALWKGGKTLINLVKVKDHEPGGEGFRLTSVSADGRTIYYEHTQDGGNLIGLDIIKSLTLPSP